LSRAPVQIAVVIVAVAAAFLLRAVAMRLFGVTLPPFILFYPGVMVIAMLCGMWPGLLATTLAALLADYWIFPVRGSFRINSIDDIVSLSFFFIMGVLVSVLADRYRKNQQRAAMSEKKLAVHEAQETLRLALEAARSGTWEWDLRSNRNVWSDELWELFCLEPHSFEPSYDAWLQVILPDDRKPVEQVVQEAAHKGAELNVEYRVRARDGGTRWMMSRGRCFRDANGVPVRYLGVVIDITDRKRAEQELRDSRARLEEMGRIAEVGGWEFDVATGKGTWTGEIARIHDLPPDAPIDVKAGLNYYSVESRPKIEKAVREVVEDARPYDLEAEIISAKGIRRWVRTIGRPVLENGKVVGVHGTMQDLNSRRRAEFELVESRRRLEVALRAAKMGVWTRDLETGEKFWDAQARAIYGIAADAPINYDNFLSLVVPEDRESVQRMELLWKEENEATVEFRIHRPDGELRWIQARGSIVCDSSGRPVRLSGVNMDVTEKKQAEQGLRSLEEQLRHAQKMEAVGRLAGGVAHDFNNLLMVIRSYAEMVQDGLAAGDVSRHRMQQILQAADRAAGLTAQLLAFSRKQIASPAVIDLNVSVGAAIKMLKRMVGEDVDLQFSGADQLWVVKVDPDQMVQVLMNLCVNSRDAMPRGGTLIISTENVIVGEQQVGKQQSPPGEYVKLSVADTGAGIDKETQEHMFEPFYTTKELGKGTGLGLSTVYGIVEQSGGHIIVTTQIGKGACFSILLPKAAGSVSTLKMADSRGPERGTETLLIAEDENALRESLVEFLRSLGYTVLEADSGHKALAASADFEGSIDLLITDVVMPRMSGRELSEMLQVLRPAIKTIYMSGYTEDAILRYGAREAGVSFLQKPFSMATLARRVREALKATQPTLG